MLIVIPVAKFHFFKDALLVLLIIEISGTFFPFLSDSPLEAMGIATFIRKVPFIIFSNSTYFMLLRKEKTSKVTFYN